MQQYKKYVEIVLYGILIIICAISLVSKIVPKIVDIVKLEMQIKEKNAQVASLLADVKKYEDYENIKKASITKLKKIYTLEDPADTVENSFVLMLDDIINITKYNNVKIFSIQYTYNPADDEFVSKGEGRYDACRLDLELISDYQNFVSMLIELIKYPYFLRIDNFKIIPYLKDKKILLIQLRLTLYVERNEKSPEALVPTKEGEAQGENQEQNGDNNGQAPAAATPPPPPPPADPNKPVGL